jgi:hypothetical protein
MNSFDKLDDSGQVAWLEPLVRKALRVTPSLSDEELDRELFERLFAFMNFRELPANPDGFRKLLLELLVAQKSPLAVIVETDLMKGGPGGAALRTDALRLRAHHLKETGQARNNAEAAQILIKETSQKLTVGTIKKLLSNPDTEAARARAPKEMRWIRRKKSLARVYRALDRVLAKLQKNYELTGLDS